MKKQKMNVVRRNDDAMKNRTMVTKKSLPLIDPALQLNVKESRRNNVRLHSLDKD